MASACDKSNPALKSSLTHSVLPYLVANNNGLCLHERICLPALSKRKERT